MKIFKVKKENDFVEIKVQCEISEIDDICEVDALILNCDFVEVQFLLKEMEITDKKVIATYECHDPEDTIKIYKLINTEFTL